MTDNLRDRIARAIRRAAYQHTYVPGPYLAGIYAEAVIAALGMRQETVYAWSKGESVPSATRYVTDWMACEIENIEPWHGKTTGNP